MGLMIGGRPNMQLYFELSVLLTETDFSAQNIDGLLGMDILNHCHLSFSGIDGICFLSFHAIAAPQPMNNAARRLEGDALKGTLKGL